MAATLPRSPGAHSWRTPVGLIRDAAVCATHVSQLHTAAADATDVAQLARNRQRSFKRDLFWATIRNRRGWLLREIV